MTTLSAKVSDFAALCDPDYVCRLPALREDLLFMSWDFEGSEAGLSGESLVLRISGTPHLFTDWSRSQLLSHVGAREKFFASVTLQEQAEELTRRLHTFENHNLRRMRTYGEGVSLLRGIVSTRYADIPDTTIMEALLNVLPEGRYIRSASGKTDKAFYAYTVSDQTPIGLRDHFMGYPGALVKNSEVGATSLWVIPYLLVPQGERLQPVVLRRRSVLRRVHRGTPEDLAKDLREALEKLKDVWGPLQSKLGRLLATSFSSEDVALEALTTALSNLKATRAFIYACTSAYSAAKNGRHNGATLFAAVLGACSSQNLDASYDEAELAGALLLQLL